MLASIVASFTLTLAQAFERAAQQNPDLIAAQARRPIAESAVTTAGALPNPFFSLSYGRDDPTLVGGIGVRVPLFGQRGAAIDAARPAVPVTAAEIATRGVEAHAAVRRAYFALVVADRHAQVAEATALLTHQLAEITRKRFEAGAAPQLDVSQAALADQRAQQDRNTQQAVRDAARPQLNVLIGDAIDAPVSPDEGSELPPELAPLETYLARLNQHPLIAGLKAEREAALARVTRERVANRPTPELAMNVERLEVPREESSLATKFVLGLRGTITFDVPALSQNQGPIATAHAEAAEAQAREEAVRARLSANVRSAWLRLQAAIRRAQFFTNEQTPTALEVERLARRSYEEGRTSLIAVLQAQSDVNAARLQAIDAFGEAQAALADLEEAVGVGF